MVKKNSGITPSKKYIPILGETNYAFIDSQNLNLGIREQGWILDFKKFRHYLWVKYSVVKAFIFIGYIKKYQPLYDFLKFVGFHLIFKPISVISEEKVKGNVDAELVLHTMIEYPNYNKALIISGDGDFCCLIDYLLGKNKFKKLLIPNRFKYSYLLRKFNRNIVFLNNLRNKVEYKK